MQPDERRRLEPLRLEPTQPPLNMVPEPPRVAAGGGRPPVALLVAVAIVFIGIGVGGGAMLVRSGPTSTTAAGSVVRTTQQAPALAAPSRSPSASSWVELLSASACEAPCCGGAACISTEANSTFRGCPPGANSCDRCPSGVACIPGECEMLFSGSEQWRLRLSAIYKRTPAGTTAKPCESGRDLWYCITSPTNPTPSCVSQLEACEHGSKGSTSIAVSTKELTNTGVEMVVRVGGPNGSIVAAKANAKYTTGIRRNALCSGLRMNFPKGEAIDYVTFFLDAAE